MRLEQARLVSSLLYDTRAMTVLNLPVFENKKYTANDCFHGYGPNGEERTNQNARISLKNTLSYNKWNLFTHVSGIFLQHKFALSKSHASLKMFLIIFL